MLPDREEWRLHGLLPKPLPAESRSRLPKDVPFWERLPLLALPIMILVM